MCWAQCSGARIKTFCCVTSLTVLAKCPLEKHSSFLGPQFNSNLLKASVLYFQGLVAFSSGHGPGVLLPAALLGTHRALSPVLVSLAKGLCLGTVKRVLAAAFQESTGCSLPRSHSLAIFPIDSGPEVTTHQMTEYGLYYS